uniref:TM2 domain-containing protein CG10795 n=1 Tax=Aceria tosichella TaxID=561515 RepID=A0A6G1S668_9ACAR
MFDVDCTHLRVGQYICPARPEIDVRTQQPIYCSPNNTAPITCHLIDGLRCQENVSQNRLNDTHFILQQPCQFTEGHSFQTTLLLAVFLGMFGADRFYLGYYAIGLLKFCTFGFMLVGQLLDIILIVTQVLRPASGYYYVMDYFGPKMNITSLPT